MLASRPAVEKDAASDLGKLNDFEFGTIEDKKSFSWSDYSHGLLCTGTCSLQGKWGTVTVHVPQKMVEYT